MKSIIKNGLLAIFLIAVIISVGIGIRSVCQDMLQLQEQWRTLEEENAELVEQVWVLEERHKNTLRQIIEHIQESTDQVVEINRLEGELRKANKGKDTQPCGTLKDPNEVVKELSLPEIVENIIGGVVHIDCPTWQGSGFVIGPNLIMTAQHCVGNIESFNITTSEGHRLHATRAISSRNHDIAFIYIDDLTCIAEKERELECKKVRHKVVLKSLELGSIKDCVLGQEVFAVGSPYGKLNFNSVTLGIISGANRNYDELNRGPYGQEADYGWSVAFSTDAAAHPGNSGCPVFTMDGKVRGVLVGGMSDVLIIAMPVDLVLEDIEEVVSMFVQSKYQFEKIPDRRFDNMYNWYQWQKDDRRLDEVYYWYLGIESVIEKMKQELSGLLGLPSNYWELVEVE